MIHGPSGDLTRSSLLRQIRQDIRAQTIAAAMLAPPSTSFSAARDRTEVIRTAAMPWGVPSHLLNAKDQTLINEGNSRFRSALQIIHWLHQAGIPWILENPYSSKCWHLPRLRKYFHDPHLIPIVSDFCMFGTPWRKRTLFLCGHLASLPQRGCLALAYWSQTFPAVRLVDDNCSAVPCGTLQNFGLLFDCAHPFLASLPDVNIPIWDCFGGRRCGLAS